MLERRWSQALFRGAQQEDERQWLQAAAAQLQLGSQEKLFLDFLVKLRNRMLWGVVKPPASGGFITWGDKGPEKPGLILKTPVLGV